MAPPQSLREIVDVERYPIGDLASERGRAFIAECRETLRKTGLVQLEGFLRPQAVAATLVHNEQLKDKAWKSENTHTVYFTESDLTKPEGHPLRRMLRSSKKALAWDLMPEQCPLKRLYKQDDMTEFIREILGLPKLYRSADPLDCCEIATFDPDCELNLHFDNSEYSVTIMLQEPEAGGDFIYWPDLRTDDNPNYEGVQRAMEGDTTGAVKIGTSPGTLAVFHGHHALHVVTPVVGSRPRVNSVLTYGPRPDMRLSDLTQMLFYGRNVAPEGSSIGKERL